MHFSYYINIRRHGGRSLRSPPCQKSRTDTNRKSKQWTTTKPTQNNHPHDVVISNIKFHLNDISSQSEIMSAVFMMLFGLAVYSSIHPKLSYFCVLELFDRCAAKFFFCRSKTWTESENHTSVLCNFFHHHLPRDISGVWTLSPLMKFTYMNPQQPHTQGLLKCAVYGLKYYGWATREKLYHSYPTTDTSLVPSHYETEPSVASRI